MKQTPDKSKFFIGIDVSKPHFDAALLVVTDHRKQPIRTAQFENNPSGLKAFDKWLKSFGVTKDEHTLVLIENTGIYHRAIWAFCTKEALPLHIGNGAHIKWSFGIARGKNDRIDSIRLCNYAFKEADMLKAAPPLDPALLQLKDLQTTRARLVSQLKANRAHLKELKATGDKAIVAQLEKALKGVINGLVKSISSIEGLQKKVLKENAPLTKTYRLLLSVPGIGPVTALYLICCTANFAGKQSGKQLACYAGLAPFEHRSGISIKGKAKVHKMANKELKALLHQGARSVVVHNKEMRTYYERKIGEGKHDLAVINAVKNKIVLRVASVVNNGKPYVDKTKRAA